MAPASASTALSATNEAAEITLLNGRRLSVAAAIDPVMLASRVQSLDPT